MDELRTYVDRTRAVRAGYAALARVGPGRPGPPDPETGERWDRANALGHVAEMLPFWTGQIREVVAGGAGFGRGEQGYARRREAIERGFDQDEASLMARIDAGIDGLLILLEELREEDLDRRSVYHGAGGDEEVDIRQPLERFLVGHLEDHLRQLEELS